MKLVEKIKATEQTLEQVMRTYKATHVLIAVVNNGNYYVCIFEPREKGKKIA
jgi:hypothetical protein